ncbi:MAG: beta-galactosidase [Acidobacteriota bacterium]
MLNLSLAGRPVRVLAIICCAFLCLIHSLNGQARTPAEKQLRSGATPPSLLLGAAWYPEQWPESRWEADLELMQKAHIHLVRVGEFAWDRMEPEEGHYDLDWLERAIDLAGKHGIFVVLGTPNKRPPEWMIQKYPEVLATPEGYHSPNTAPWQFNFSSQKYRQFIRAIDEQLARRFGHNPYVIAWQLGNEIGPASYDDATRKDFQAWLKVRYGTLDELNRRWHTDYHSTRYTDWSQIPLASDTGYPALQINWYRFVTDTWRSFEKNEVNAIRPYADPRQLITTNLMGWYDNFNQYEVMKDLDFAAWDDPLGKRGGFYDPVDNGARNDLARSLKHRNFWIMETTFGSNIAKGEMRAAIWADIGHGADTVSYWQWRDALNGSEEYHRGQIVNADGTPAPIYKEIAQTGSEFDKADHALAGTSVHADVAIVYSYDSRWALQWQRNGKEPPFKPVQELLSYYRPLHELGNSIDVVAPTDNLAQYKLVVAPGMQLLTAAAAANLKRYVQNGGNLVLGERSGLLDDDASRWPALQPGPLRPMLGGSVAQYFALPKPVLVSGEWGNAEAKTYAEQLQVDDPGTRVMMRFGRYNGWLDGQPAVITRKVGKGSITYFGVWMDAAAMKKAARWMMKSSGVTPDLPSVPEGVDVQRRTGDSKDVLIFENFSTSPETFTLPSVRRSVLSGNAEKSVTLPAYGVAVLAK